MDKIITYVAEILAENTEEKKLSENIEVLANNVQDSSSVNNTSENVVKSNTIKAFSKEKWSYLLYTLGELDNGGCL